MRQHMRQGSRLFCSVNGRQRIMMRRASMLAFLLHTPHAIALRIQHLSVAS